MENNSTKYSVSKKFVFQRNINAHCKLIPIDRSKSPKKEPRALSMNDIKHNTKSLIKHDLKTISYKIENRSLKASLSQVISQTKELKDTYQKKINDLKTRRKKYKESIIHILKHLTSCSKSLSYSSEVLAVLKTLYLDDDSKKIVEEFERKTLLRKSIEENKDYSISDIVNEITDTKLNSETEHTIEVIALEKFYVNIKGYLDLEPGDRIQVIEKPNSVWWVGKKNSLIGKFPVKSVMND